jgi:hypothetical protein
MRQHHTLLPYRCNKVEESLVVQTTPQHHEVGRSNVVFSIKLALL